MSKGKFTPSEAKPLVKDESGEPTSGMLSYSKVMGMILYLSRHNSPYVYLAMNLFIPKRSHKLALKIL